MVFAELPCLSEKVGEALNQRVEHRQQLRTDDDVKILEGRLRVCELLRQRVVEQLFCARDILRVGCDAGLLANASCGRWLRRDAKGLSSSDRNSGRCDEFLKRDCLRLWIVRI